MDKARHHLIHHAHCARCQAPLSTRQRQLPTLLCSACETEWRRDFERGQRHHLGKPAPGRCPAPVDAGEQAILLATD